MPPATVYRRCSSIKTLSYSQFECRSRLWRRACACRPSRVRRENPRHGSFHTQQEAHGTRDLGAAGPADLLVNEKTDECRIDHCKNCGSWSASFATSSTFTATTSHPRSLILIARLNSANRVFPDHSGASFSRFRFTVQSSKRKARPAIQCANIREEERRVHASIRDHQLVARSAITPDKFTDDGAEAKGFELPAEPVAGLNFREVHAQNFDRGRGRGRLKPLTYAAK